MELTGKIISVLPMQTGTSANTGNQWQLQTYILQTQEQYPKTIAVELFGIYKIQQCNIQEGEIITAHIDIESREFNGRWYTSVRAWKIERPDDSAVPAQQPVQSTQQAPSQQAQIFPDRNQQPVAPAQGLDDGDELPF